MALTQVQPGMLASDSQYTGFKNKLINGQMQIDQRNAGASVALTTASGYTLDRWYFNISQNSKLTTQQNAGSVTPPAGFTKYLGITSVSAYTPGSSETFEIAQNIEGFNVADLGFGTANAQTVTVSFWVYSSLTGTFGGTLQNETNTRSYPFSYTISSANTWTRATVTIAGCTDGTWNKDNTGGMKLRFNVGNGTNLLTTAGSWYSADYRGVTGNINVVGTNGATFYITGVQLEKGSTATSFDYRPYGTELQLCQRYYWKGNLPIIYNFTGSAIAVNSSLSFPVTMRATPTTTIANVTGIPTSYPDSFSGYLNSIGSGSAYVPGIGTASAEL